MAPVTLKEKAYVQLKKMILEADYKPGEFLTERTLVDAMGMSRTPIRSALERLDVEGLVKYTPNKGLVVAELSIGRAMDFYDYRIALESHLVRKLAGRAFPEEHAAWFRNNLELQRACTESGDAEQFTILDCDFHCQLAHVYDNKEITRSMDQLQNRMFQILIKVMKRDVSRIRGSYEDHQRIMDCILRQNKKEAEQEIVRHLEYGRQILIS
jgi:DNA-binding GntR family transcriptional regulator